MLFGLMTVKFRDDLAGNFDLELAITSAEENQAKAESLAFMLQTLGNTVNQEMTQMILSEICDLRKMPELAERVRRFTPPPPDPMQQKLQEMQIELLQAQIEKLHAEAGKSEADTQLSNAKAQSEIYGTQLDMQLRPQELLRISLWLRNLILIISMIFRVLSISRIWNLWLNRLKLKQINLCRKNLWII